MGTEQQQFTSIPPHHIQAHTSTCTLPEQGPRTISINYVYQHKQMQPWWNSVLQKATARCSELSLLAQTRGLVHSITYCTYLCDGEDHVGGGGVLTDAASQLVAHHFRQHHADGLPQHHSFRLNSPHSPAQHPKTVDHGCV